MNMQTHATGALRNTGDALSITTLLGTLAGVLPAIAALATIIWTTIRIYETDTVRRWLKGKKDV